MQQSRTVGKNKVRRTGRLCYDLKPTEHSGCFCLSSRERNKVLFHAVKYVHTQSRRHTENTLIKVDTHTRSHAATQARLCVFEQILHRFKIAALKRNSITVSSVNPRQKWSRVKTGWPEVLRQIAICKAAHADQGQTLGHGETFKKQNDARKMSKWCESNTENPKFSFWYLSYR